MALKNCNLRAISGQQPLTKKALREACKGTYRETRRKLKQGLGVAPMFYYVLTVIYLNAKDQKVVEKGLAVCTTPTDCKLLAQKQVGWLYRDISLVKDFDCGVLQYKGLAVAVYFKRQVTKIEPEPMDPIPVGHLETLDDAWARLDLFSKSPRQLVDALNEELIDARNTITDLTQQLQATQTLMAAATKQASKKPQEVDTPKTTRKTSTK